MNDEARRLEFCLMTGRGSRSLLKIMYRRSDKWHLWLVQSARPTSSIRLPHHLNEENLINDVLWNQEDTISQERGKTLQCHSPNLHRSPNSQTHRTVAIVNSCPTPLNVPRHPQIRPDASCKTRGPVGDTQGGAEDMVKGKSNFRWLSPERNFTLSIRTD